jgi:ElaB/YqjD/DUF883 family membrane-anchored ribosome-binding protein
MPELDPEDEIPGLFSVGKYSFSRYGNYRRGVDKDLDIRSSVSNDTLPSINKSESDLSNVSSSSSDILTGKGTESHIEVDNQEKEISLDKSNTNINVEKHTPKVVLSSPKIDVQGSKYVDDVPVVSKTELDINIDSSIKEVIINEE